MKYISFDEADHKLTWTGIADAIEAGHRLDRAKIDDLLMRNETNSLLTRAAWIDGLGIAVKSMSVYPANPGLTPPLPSIDGAVLLFDPENGTLKAVLDGILVTKWKTAGDSVLGARLLARKDSKRHLMVGAGTVAASAIKAYQEVFPSLDTFMVWNRTPQRAEKLAEELSATIPGVTVVEDLQAACSGADIITSATMSNEPVLKGEWINPGTHVDLIGAFRPDMREADDALISGCELFVDSRDTTFHHIGEIEIPLQSGVIKRSDVLGDFYDLCNAKAGRSTPEAITVFKNGGGAHLDAMTSNMIFEAVSAE